MTRILAEEPGKEPGKEPDPQNTSYATSIPADNLQRLMALQEGLEVLITQKLDEIQQLLTDWHSMEEEKMKQDKKRGRTSKAEKWMQYISVKPSSEAHRTRRRTEYESDNPGMIIPRNDTPQTVKAVTAPRCTSNTWMSRVTVKTLAPTNRSNDTLAVKGDTAQGDTAQGDTTPDKSPQSEEPPYRSSDLASIAKPVEARPTTTTMGETTRMEGNKSGISLSEERMRSIQDRALKRKNRAEQDKEDAGEEGGGERDGQDILKKFPHHMPLEHVPSSRGHLCSRIGDQNKTQYGNSSSREKYDTVMPQNYSCY